MAWCPNCKTEYIPGVTRCPDCGAALVDALPPDRDPPPLDMALLTTVTNNGEIAQLHGLLDSAGIPFYALDRGSGGYLRIVMGHSVYGQEIYVERSRLEEARTLLRAYLNRRGVMVFEDDEELVPEPEPESGSYWVFVAVIAVFLVLFLYSIVTGSWG